MPSKVQISRRHWQQWKGDPSVSAIVVPTLWSYKVSDARCEICSQRLPVKDSVNSVKKHYVTGPCLHWTFLFQRVRLIVVVFTALMLASRYQADIEEMSSPAPLTLSLPLSLLLLSQCPFFSNTLPTHLHQSLQTLHAVLRHFQTWHCWFNKHKLSSLHHGLDHPFLQRKNRILAPPIT